jgi:hypothetical protein
MRGWTCCVIAAAAAVVTPRPCLDVAVRVDGRPIRAAQVAVAAEIALRRSPGTDRAQAYRSALEGLITREILSHEAQTRGITPDATAVDAARRDVRALFGEDMAWSALLTAHGFDAAAYETELRLQVLARGVSVQVAEAIPVATAAEAEAHIRAHTSGTNKPTAEQVESARWDLTRLRRTAATRQFVEDARAKARIERNCEY